MTGALIHWHHNVEARTAELAVSYRRFRAITDSASDAIVSLNARGQVVFWNPRAITVFGYTELEAIGHFIDILVPDNLRQNCSSRPSKASHQATPKGSGVRSKPQRCAATDHACPLSSRSPPGRSSDAEVFYTGSFAT